MSQAITRASRSPHSAHASPREMAAAGGLHPFGVAVLLAGAFLPIADFFIEALWEADRPEEEIEDEYDARLTALGL